MRRSSKLKKAGAAILTAVMTMSLLAGCSGKRGNGNCIPENRGNRGKPGWRD